MACGTGTAATPEHLALLLLPLRPLLLLLMVRIAGRPPLSQKWL
jgi:hypothetical protein